MYRFISKGLLINVVNNENQLLFSSTKMGISDNWESFVNMTKAKAETHSKLAQYWNKVHHSLGIITLFLASLTTVATMMPISMYFATALSILSSFISGITTALHPSNQRQIQMDSSKSFEKLMLRMVRVETEREYEELWKEYNWELLSEPFVAEGLKVVDNSNLGMTPEFTIVVRHKEDEVRDALGECL